MKTTRDDRLGPEHVRGWRLGAAVACLAGLVGCGGGNAVDAGTGSDGSVTDGGRLDGTATDSSADSGQPPSDIVATDAPDAGGDAGTDVGPNILPVPPTQFVGGTSFARPLDVVLTGNGTTAFFIAYDPMSGAPEVFRSTGGTVTTVVAQGAPLDAPLGLAISADDSSIYIADGTASGASPSVPGFGAILRVAGTGGTVSLVNLQPGIHTPRAVAIYGAAGSENLLFIASDAMGAGVFRVAVTGGTATRLETAGTLLDPVALTAASDGSAYVLAALGRASGSVLYIPAAGGTPVPLPTGTPLNSLRMRTPAGIALSQDGQSLLMTAWDPANGPGLLTWMSVHGTGATSPALFMPTGLSGLVSPCGLHRARNTENFAVADELSAGTGAILGLH